MYIVLRKKSFLMSSQSVLIFAINNETEFLIDVQYDIIKITTKNNLDGLYLRLPLPPPLPPVVVKSRNISFSEEFIYHMYLNWRLR